MPIDLLETADDVVDYAQSQLTRAVPDGKHPWHWPLLITGGTGRVVVLRAWNTASETLLFCTDRRSDKVAALADAQGDCAFVFYHGRHRTQLRVQGFASEVTTAARRDEFWRKQNVRSMRSYATLQAPGTPLAQADGGLSANWLNETPTQAELAAAFTNFAAYEVRAKNFDFLQLSPQGQRRSEWQAGAIKSFSWVCP